MKDAAMSKHASARAQQRAIPPLIVDWLFAYGASRADHSGAEILYFDHAARRRIGRTVGQQIVDRLGALLDTYAVVSPEGTVITVGHRLKRLARA
ncbi:hypothetical protein ABC977_02315 [Thioalkalicoccus limnaeus]|uniref:DUF4258 domain-containing protein n=1 Tax=Thioalkalicoccus limnaeus TaxID=120681 RepID=A0ABV4BA04_9GAMM